MFKRENTLKAAQLTILVVVGLTVVNIGLLLSGILFGVPYALYSPQLFAFWSSYAFELGDNMSGIINFLIFFVIVGAFLSSYTFMGKTPKMVGLALLIFTVDTLYSIKMMYVPMIYDPVVLITISVSLVSLGILYRFYKMKTLMIGLGVINVALLIFALSDANRAIVLFDLIFKFWILVTLGLATQVAFKKGA
jgi:hypothetical protein